ECVLVERARILVDRNGLPAVSLQSDFRALLILAVPLGFGGAHLALGGFDGLLRVGRDLRELYFNESGQLSPVLQECLVFLRRRRCSVGIALEDGLALLL